MTKTNPAASLQSFAQSLVGWYRTNRRDLPWRRTSDAYQIWLSEVMLQQTTVATVESRWGDFLAKFPTVRALADASEEDVIAAWRGLGYYRRAKNLHAAAGQVGSAHHGVFPTKFIDLQTLPGVGEYTAAAVSSIAAGEPVAVLDANVRRVMARVVACDRPVDQEAGLRVLRESLNEFLDRDSPGDFNQGMMELGATVCLPREPRCHACPVAIHCRAHKLGKETEYPLLAPRAPMEGVSEYAVAILRRGRALWLKRPESGSFAGMWELPRAEADPSLVPESEAARIVRELTGINSKPKGPEHSLRHVVMRRKIELSLFVIAARTGEPELTQHVAAEWLTPAEALARPTSTTQHALARFLHDRL
jgi:A/G-specific adenine glycosylase